MAMVVVEVDLELDLAQKRGEEDPSTHMSKSVEDLSTKGEKLKKIRRGGEDKGKGKQVMSDEDFYYKGEHVEFDTFNIQEELPGENEFPGVMNLNKKLYLDEWEEEEVPLDSQFDEEFKK